MRLTNPKHGGVRSMRLPLSNQVSNNNTNHASKSKMVATIKNKPKVG